MYSPWKTCMKFGQNLPVWIQPWRTRKCKHRRLFVLLSYFQTVWMFVVPKEVKQHREQLWSQCEISAPHSTLSALPVLWGGEVTSLNIHMALTGHHLRRGLPGQHLSNLCFPSEWALTYLRFSRVDLLGGLQPWHEGQMKPPVCGLSLSSKISASQSNVICTHPVIFDIFTFFLRNWLCFLKQRDVSISSFNAPLLTLQKTNESIWSIHVQWLSFYNDWGHIPGFVQVLENLENACGVFKG